MPFNHCIAAALADQLITADEHAHYSETYAQFEREFRDQMTPHEAAAEAARETFRYIEEDAAETRRKTFLALSVQNDLARRMDEYRTPVKGAADPYTAARGFLSQFTPGRNGHAVEAQHGFWRGEALRQMDQAFDTFSRDFLARRRNRPRLENIVREAFGENSGDAAAQHLAKGWKRASETLRQAFNRFGGHIDKLEDWGLPQSHDADRVRHAGFDTWRQFIAPLLDRGRMVDRVSGRPLSDDALTDVLRTVYDTIRTRGWAGKEATGTRGSALANKRAEARVLHFKDASSWFSYAERFGHNDPIDAMMGHIDRMSRDVALLQVLGPNPKAMLGWVKNELSRRWEMAKREGEPTVLERLKDSSKNDAVRAGDAIDAMYAILTHSNADPAFPVLADVADDIQNLATAAQIPGVMIAAAPGDLATARIAAKMNALPFTKMMGEYLSHFDPTNAEHRLAALHAGLSAEHYGRSMGRSGRFMMEINGHRWSAWLADRALALSGLTQHTVAGRNAAGLAFYSHIAAQAGKGFDALDPAFRAMLERAQIGAGDWDHIRATTPYESSRGAKYIRPGDIFERKDLDATLAMDLASKVNDVAGQIVERAVPSSTLEGRALVRGTARRGTPRDFLAGSLAMYHQYGATMMLTHVRDAFTQPSPRKMAQYATYVVALTTLAGAVALQLKEIANGRDPRDMTDWRFWAAAMSQGGGLSILGDFLFAGLQGENRAGKGLTDFLTGSRIGFISDLVNTTFGNPLGPASKKPNPNRQTYAGGWVDFAKRYSPGGSMWYARLALERFLWDHLQEAVDPGWARRAPRIERWYKRQFGNSYWWHHGDAAPERAPDLSSAAGAAQ